MRVRGGKRNTGHAKAQSSQRKGDKNLCGDVTDFYVHDGRGYDGAAIVGVTVFEVHSAAQVCRLQHGAAPVAAADSYQHRFGAEFGMAGNESEAVVTQDERVSAILR